MKHKNLAIIVISFLLVGSVGMMSMLGVNINETDLENVAVLLAKQINRFHPLAGIYTQALIYGNNGLFILFVVISIAVFLLFVSITACNYVTIHTKLTSHKTNSNYKLTSLHSNSVFKALYWKEMKLFFSSALYVTNAGAGYIFMLVSIIILLVVGVDKITGSMPIGGYEYLIYRLIPFGFAFMGGICPTTTSSISMEGGRWWILLSLPVTTKDVYLSKLLVNISLGLPLCMVSSIIAICALPISILEGVAMIVVPICYCIFGAVLGLYINILKPLFVWDNEAMIIKQSSAMVFSMLGDIIAIAIPIPFAVVFKGYLGEAMILFCMVILLFLSYRLYKKICTIELTTI